MTSTSTPLPYRCFVGIDIAAACRDTAGELNLSAILSLPVSKKPRISSLFFDQTDQAADLGT